MLVRIETEFMRVSQFTADASHELRTPVALIRTEAEIALRKSRDETEYREALGHILAEAENTSTLIETLLSLARADAGREKLDMKPVDLGQLTRKAADQWRHTIAAKHLNFSEDLGSNLRANGDEMALLRLLGVLLDNAVKYTPAPGSIELTLAQSDHAGIIKIRDTGIGIAADDQGKIFERFYRADKARTREMGGVGLGLAIGDWIVQKHHGRMTVDSAPGQGSTFTVELPLAAETNGATGSQE
jgi:signal transduction histidine kinase